MAERATTAPDEGSETKSAPTAKPAKASFFKRFLTPTWLLLVIGVSIVLHGAGFAYYRMRNHTEQAPSAEISLGVFHFEADKAESGHAAKAEFTLHVALLEPVDPAAKQRLAMRKFHIQQDVEELLRKAHSGDFDDPGLQELKRQLHEQINQAIGIRAVSEIIITDLKLQRNGRAKDSSSVAEAEVR